MNIIDKFRLNGKKAYITGGAGGIGRSVAIALAQAGADVALVDIKEKEEMSRQFTGNLSKDYGIKAISVSADVSDPQSVDAMIQTIGEAFGTIDIAHNNAGTIAGTGFDLEIPFEEWRRNVEINLFGIFLTGRAAARVMIKSGKGGSIINTASMSGMIVNDVFHDTPGGSAYPASKAGVIHLTKVQAVQWAKYNIRVNSISPGVILSGIHDGFPPEPMEFSAMRTPMKRLGEVEELQGVVLYLASDASSYTTGANIVVDGGYTIW
jgi:NAD(P)-dependent dehydrogenase (short-subunit alcohol dehydrogenase family)